MRERWGREVGVLWRFHGFLDFLVILLDSRGCRVELLREGQLEKDFVGLLGKVGKRIKKLIYLFLKKKNNI